MFDPIWVLEALGDILISIVSNSRFGKRPGVCDMAIFWFHFLPHVTSNVFSYWLNFHNLAPRPSARLNFVFWSSPYGWEIRICVHHLRRVDFWGKCTIRIRHDSDTIPQRFKHESDTNATRFRQKEKNCLRRRPSMNGQWIMAFVRSD